MISLDDLIVGADSMVGAALLYRAKRAGRTAMGTTRRPVSRDGHLSLDFAQDLDAWQPPPGIRAAYLCAGVTRIQDCQLRPEESERINVQSICAAARALRRNGTFVVYLSTNQVFDGSVAFRPAGAPSCPTTVYGAQKAAAERRLIGEGSVDAIVRFMKILGPRTQLFLDWASALRRQEPVRAFSDMNFAPVPLSFVANALLMIGTFRLAGTFQVSGNRDISYEQAARMGAKALNQDPGLVQGTSITDSALTGHDAPSHTTLDMREVAAELGIVPPDVQWTIETAFVSPRDLFRDAPDVESGAIPSLPNDN